jgi:hypothetical protein
MGAVVVPVQNRVITFKTQRELILSGRQHTVYHRPGLNDPEKSSRTVATAKPGYS